jgi:hypothetical protein
MIWYFLWVCNFVNLRAGFGLLDAFHNWTQGVAYCCNDYLGENLVSQLESGIHFEYRVLRRKFEPTLEEVTWGLRKLHNEKFHYSYSSPNNTSMVISRRIRWTGHVARMGDKENKHRPICSFWSQWNRMRGCGLNSSDTEMGNVASPIKWGEFLD